MSPSFKNMCKHFYTYILKKYVVVNLLTFQKSAIIFIPANKKGWGYDKIPQNHAYSHGMYIFLIFHVKERKYFCHDKILCKIQNC